MTADPAKYHFTEDKPSDDEEPGALCDVAPTVLELLVRLLLLASLLPLAELTIPFFFHLRQGLPKPQGTSICSLQRKLKLIIDLFSLDMTGRSLLATIE
jgi:2,3-bisphosphoglycerate-independent phosphoglycerate mutase